MKNFFWLILLGLSLTSCGDFFQFQNEPEDWTGVTMKILNDSSCVMVGDSMPLAVKFAPDTISDGAVYWLLGDSSFARLQNDTLLAVQPGQLELTAIGGGGRLSDKCKVNIIERWNSVEFNRMHPSDMVIYADIKVNGKPWDDSTMMVGAFVGGELTGMAIRREAFGISYAELRIWAPSTTGQGRIDLRCYDRLNFRLYILHDEIEYNAYQTLGTLSDLYSINFTQ